MAISTFYGILIVDERKIRGALQDEYRLAANELMNRESRNAVR